MRPTATRPSAGQIAGAAIALLGLAMMPACAQAPAAPLPLAKRLLILPAQNAEAPASIPTGAALIAAEAAVFPWGLHLGMSPEEVNGKLAHPVPSVAKSAMTQVPYLLPAEVDSFTVGLADAGDSKAIIVSCFGAPSRVVFMFIARKLYAISFRFEHDNSCPNVAGAADDLFQHLLTVPEAAMPSEHYEVGDVDVVDVWDKTVDSVVRRRWRGR
jgi:hypothetical protein